MPKFANSLAWQQAELLMQPAFIRVIANISKELERSTWKGTYEDILVWAEGTSDETKAIVTQLRQQLETATPEAAEGIQERLEKLPQPYPGYQLCLQQQQQQVMVDLWQLCYQVCFRNYNPVLNALDSDLKVEVDASLIDEMGEVDWQRLDDKANYLVGQIFANLPDAQKHT
jgi:hypothetical protein